MDNCIEINGVTKKFTSTVALDDVSLGIGLGKIHGLLGENGAGKTTLMRCLAQLIIPDSGEINFQANKMNVNFMSSFPDSYGEISVRSYLEFIGRINNIENLSNRISHVLEVCGLTEKNKKAIIHLSSGQKRRLMLAHVLLPDAHVLVLDEPTNGLDPLSMIEVRNLILRLRHHKTIVISSHLMNEMQILCDEVSILHKGKVLQTGTVEDVCARFNFHKKFDFEVCNWSEVALARIGELGAEVTESKVLDDRTIGLNVISRKSGLEISTLIKVFVDHNIKVIKAVQEKESLENVFKKTMMES